MTRSRFIIVLVVLAVLGGGAALVLSGRGFSIGGSKAPATKVVLDPVTFAEPFIVNLSDTDSIAFAKLQIAVQLEPMTKSDKDRFLLDQNGAEGGGEAKSGETMLASDPVLRDAVVSTVSRFSSQELLTSTGKTKLKQALLASFDHVAAEETARRGKGADHDAAAPPYHVSDVLFPDFAVQVNS